MKQSYLYNGNSYAGKTTSSYWYAPLVSQLGAELHCDSILMVKLPGHLRDKINGTPLTTRWGMELLLHIFFAHMWSTSTSLGHKGYEENIHNISIWYTSARLTSLNILLTIS